MSELVYYKMEIDSKTVCDVNSFLSPRRQSV